MCDQKIFFFCFVNIDQTNKTFCRSKKTQFFHWIINFCSRISRSVIILLLQFLFVLHVYEKNVQIFVCEEKIFILLIEVLIVGGIINFCLSVQEKLYNFLLNSIYSINFVFKDPIQCVISKWWNYLAFNDRITGKITMLFHFVSTHFVYIFCSLRKVYWVDRRPFFHQFIEFFFLTSFTVKYSLIYCMFVQMNCTQKLMSGNSFNLMR